MSLLFVEGLLDVRVDGAASQKLWCRMNKETIELFPTADSTTAIRKCTFGAWCDTRERCTETHHRPIAAWLTPHTARVRCAHCQRSPSASTPSSNWRAHARRVPRRTAGSMCVAIDRNRCLGTFWESENKTAAPVSAPRARGRERGGAAGALVVDVGLGCVGDELDCADPEDDEQR